MKLSLNKIGFRSSVVATLVWAISLTCQAATTPNSSIASDSSNNVTSAKKKSLQQDDDSDLEPYAPGTNNLALDVGQVFLMGNMGNNYSDAIGTQLHYTYGVSDLFGFDSSVGYSSHSDGQFSMATALMGLRTNLSYYDRVVPYSIFGLGFYKPSYTYQTSTGQDSLSPILFGVHLGFGVDLLISHRIFFGSALTFHDIFGGDDRQTPAGPIAVGGTFTSFLVHLGYTF
jgi:hypothetical protein